MIRTLTFHCVVDVASQPGVNIVNCDLNKRLLEVRAIGRVSGIFVLDHYAEKNLKEITNLCDVDYVEVVRSAGSLEQEERDEEEEEEGEGEEYKP
ncbi:hypothetical protein H0H93_000808 [Arthromyces matolae]|nr:hypothetical protein H0H93_000808 [Arthromyces matolae]